MPPIQSNGDTERKKQLHIWMYGISFSKVPGTLSAVEYNPVFLDVSLTALHNTVTIVLIRYVTVSDLARI